MGCYVLNCWKIGKQGITRSKGEGTWRSVFHIVDRVLGGWGGGVCVGEMEGRREAPPNVPCTYIQNNGYKNPHSPIGAQLIADLEPSCTPYNDIFKSTGTNCIITEDCTNTCPIVNLNSPLADCNRACKPTNLRDKNNIYQGGWVGGMYVYHLFSYVYVYVLYIGLSLH